MHHDLSLCPLMLHSTFHPLSWEQENLQDVVCEISNESFMCRDVFFSRQQRLICTQVQVKRNYFIFSLGPGTSSTSLFIPLIKLTQTHFSFHLLYNSSSTYAVKDSPWFALLGEPICKMDRDTLQSQGKLLILESRTQNKTSRLHMKGLMNIYK